MTTTSPTSAVELLARFERAGVLGPLDVQTARALGRLSGDTRPAALLAAAMACRAPSRGHVCVELGRLREGVRLERASGEVDLDALPWPSVGELTDALSSSPLVRGPADATPTPLVLSGQRLYLDRYWRYERRLVAALAQRLTGTPAPVDEAVLRQGLDRLFPPGSAPTGVDLQRVAAEAAVRRRVAVITGGPGTGKTSTVVRLLALLVEQARAAGQGDPRIALLAPTGKAAARLAESVRRARAKLDVTSGVLAALEAEASTLHRRLGYQPATPTRFRHGPHHPLPVDVVVVDEASMVDLALMTKLVEAVPPGARLILLGDRDQLASVEAGAVLGDLCAAPALGPAVVALTHTYRFGAHSGIGALARAMNAGDVPSAMAALSGHDDVDLVPVAAPGDLLALRSLVVAGYRPALEATDAAGALVAFDRFRVLTAHRHGAAGVEGFGRLAERWLAEAGLIDPRTAFYRGRPVMVTENDHALGLYNGDIGLVLEDPEAGGELRVFFPDPSGQGVRTLHPARLPQHETVWSMTVHKSQGSEFDHVLLVLPHAPSPILTRELLYTGVTRAKQRVTLAGAPEVIEAGLGARVERASGLRDQPFGADSAANTASAASRPEA